MTQATPAASLAAAAQTLTLGTVGTDMFVGLARRTDATVPRKAIFFQDYGGAQPEPYFGTAKQSVWAPRVQVLVRDEPAQYQRGENTCRSVLEKLHRATVSGFVDVLALQSSPTPIGPDGDGCHRWTMNFQMRVVQR